MRTTLLPFAVLATALSLPAQAGVSDDAILLGQSCALKGPARGLGNGMKAGLEVFFGKANASGGVNGRKIELISVNDGYEPKKAEMATKLLINKKKVFLLIGEVGTPTSKVTVPIAEAADVPFVGPFTGAEFLRNPYRKWVVNVRGSYYQEMERLAQHLVDGLGYKRIACFYQNDGYGKAGLTGIVKALERRGMELCSTGHYKRNTLAVAKGLKDVAAGDPQAVIMVGAYKPCAQFIKQAKKHPKLVKNTFCNISFVGTKNLLSELKGQTDNCIVSQVVPYPWDTSIPLIKEYQAAMKKAGKSKDIGFITLEGYMVAKFFCQVIEKIDGTPTREKFIATVNSVGNFDLGGIKLGFGPKDHQGMDQVFLTRLEGNRALVLEEAHAAPGK